MYPCSYFILRFTALVHYSYLCHNNVPQQLWSPRSMQILAFPSCLCETSNIKELAIIQYKSNRDSLTCEGPPRFWFWYSCALALWSDWGCPGMTGVYTWFVCGTDAGLCLWFLSLAWQASLHHYMRPQSLYYSWKDCTYYYPSSTFPTRNYCLSSCIAVGASITCL